MNVFLQGAVDEAAFSAKTADLKAQVAEVERQLDGAGKVTEENGRLVLSVFDVSQKLVDAWRRTNSEDKRQIVDCVRLNRTMDDVLSYWQRERRSTGSPNGRF